MSDEAKKLQVAIEATSNLPETAAKDAAALKNVKQEAGETAEKMELLKKPSDELRRLSADLERAVPGLGEAFRILRGGAMGAIGGIVAGFVELKMHIDETDKALNEMAEKNTGADFLGNIIGQLNTLSSAAADTQSFTDALNKLADANNNLNIQLQDQLNLLKAVERAKASQVSAEKGLAIATIQADEAAQRITPEQAAQRRAQVEKDYLQKEQQANEAAQAEQFKAKEIALAQAMAQQRQLEAAAAAKKAEVEQAEQHERGVQIDPNEQREKIAAARAEADAAQEEFENIHRMDTGNPWYVLKWGGFSRGAWRAEKARDEKEKAEAKIAQLEQQRREFEATQTPIAKAEDQAKVDAAQTAEEKARANQELIAKLQHQLEQTRNETEITRPIDRTTTDLKIQTIDQQERQREIKQFEEGAKWLQHFDTSSKLTPETVAEARIQIANMVELMNHAAETLRGLADWKVAQNNLWQALQILSNQQKNSAQNTFSQ